MKKFVMVVGCFVVLAIAFTGIVAPKMAESYADSAYQQIGYPESMFGDLEKASLLYDLSWQKDVEIDKKLDKLNQIRTCTQDLRDKYDGEITYEGDQYFVDGELRLTVDDNGLGGNEYGSIYDPTSIKPLATTKDGKPISSGPGEKWGGPVD